MENPPGGHRHDGISRRVLGNSVNLLSDVQRASSLYEVSFFILNYCLSKFALISISKYSYLALPREKGIFVLDFKIHIVVVPYGGLDELCRFGTLPSMKLKASYTLIALEVVVLSQGTGHFVRG